MRVEMGTLQWIIMLLVTVMLEQINCAKQENLARNNELRGKLPTIHKEPTQDGSTWDVWFGGRHSVV